ncbi:sporulation-control protein [Stackebrandtia albiflava]|uniref:Sporulation-control protein n=1 Tax=Stackebrandtia albiflava TaxID=406432 RepID=A0A562VEP6_9ACTN|nr:sporulation protein [Stackebrandtia albiflava]TWJ16359.1 sporulation-control protein [Stackebrandtia albiflava]
MLRKLKAAFAAGVEVDTVLTETHVTPGGTVRGEVRLTGGREDHRVQHVTLDLQSDVDGADPVDLVCHRAGEGFALPAGSPQRVEFAVPLPWETPVTGIGGQALEGVRIGVVTELALEHAFDKGDLDPLSVEPLPSQHAALKAVDTLGFVFHRVRMSPGGLTGSELPLRQQFEYWTAGGFREAFRLLRLGFVTGPAHLDVHLEVDKHEDGNSTGGAAIGHVRIGHEDTDVWDRLRTELQRLADRPGMFG